MGYYDGVNGFDVGFSYARAENNGDIDEDNLLYDLQYTRDLSAATYGFANLTGEIDGRTVGSAFDTSDNYLGVGFGYRAVDTATTQWTIQAGLGYRLQESTGVARTSLDEPAISISSGYYNQFTETLALNFDTDIIGSDSNTTVRNEIGLNVSMTDTLALRTSLNTVFNTEPAAGLKDTDNTLGVSLVYNFR